MTHTSLEWSTKFQGGQSPLPPPLLLFPDSIEAEDWFLLVTLLCCVPECFGAAGPFLLGTRLWSGVLNVRGDNSTPHLFVVFSDLFEAEDHFYWSHFFGVGGGLCPLLNQSEGPTPPTKFQGGNHTSLEWSTQFQERKLHPCTSFWCSLTCLKLRTFFYQSHFLGVRGGGYATY